MRTPTPRASHAMKKAAAKVPSIKPSAKLGGSKTGPGYANRAYSSRAPQSVSLNPAALGPLGNIQPTEDLSSETAGLDKPGIRRKRLGKYEVLS